MINQDRRFCAVAGPKLDQVKRSVAVCKRTKDRIRLCPKYLMLAERKIILRQLHYLLKQSCALVIVKVF